MLDPVETVNLDNRLGLGSSQGLIGAFAVPSLGWMKPDEALVLAAWLVMMSELPIIMEGGNVDERFAAILERVRNV